MITINPQQEKFEKLELFLKNHNKGNFYQSVSAYQVYKNTKNYEPILVISEEGENVNGILSGVIVKEGNLKEFFSSRCIISGGPVVIDNDPKIAIDMLNKLEEKTESKVIYTEIREVFPSEFDKLFNSAGYESEDRLNIIIDLRKDVDTLWSEVNSKRRNKIRRAEKEGTSVKELITLDEVNSSYLILKEVYSSAKLPIADVSLFIESFRLLHKKGNIRFFGAFNSGKLIGTRYVLCYNKRATDWYAGSKREYYDKYPNDIIPWEVFKILKADGFETFDFGGAGKPDVPYGVRDYKKNFGGDLIGLKRYRKINKPVLYKVGKAGLKLMQLIK